MINFIKRLFERPAPVIRFEFDESRIAVARPGDVVVLHTPRNMSGGQMKALQEHLHGLHAMAPGVTFCVACPGWSAVVLATGAE